MLYDVVIVGGGPGGLAAALTLGRARKQVLLCDSGPRRNALAEHIYNFVTRDETPPNEFRRIGRQQLARYPNVEVRDAHVESIAGTGRTFQVALSSGTVEARRILLCTGLVDEMLPIDGFRELWGHAIFQCPYCHGWEVQDRRWGYLVVGADGSSHFLPFALKLRGWTRDVSVFTDGTFEIEPEARQRLQAAGIRLETSPVARLVAREQQLEAVELANGTRVPCEVLFAHPPQQQVELVRALDLALDDDGFVQVDAEHKTSVPGIFAAGDLTMKLQGAIFAASAGAKAAAIINADLAMELA